MDTETYKAIQEINARLTKLEKGKGTKDKETTDKKEDNDK